MSLINQDIRYAVSGGPNNPEALYSFIKPMRLVFNTSNPLPETGENEWFLLNTTTGDLFQKTNGTWYLVYNFVSGGGGGGGITNIENDGTGLGWFRNIIGSTAHFKSVSGALNELDIIDLTDEIQIAMSPAYVPPLLENLVGSKKISGDSFAPPPTADSSLGFSVGSIWTQTGAGGNIYSCLDATVGAAVWKFIGPFECENLGALGGSVFAQQTVPPSLPRYQFRKLIGTTGEIDITQNPENLEISVAPEYVPLTLDKVPNVFNSFEGSLFGPTVNTDSTLGYQKGSIYTQISAVPNAGHVWICADATAGAAVWKDVSASPTILSFDYINWTMNAPYVQTILGGWQDWNAGATVDVVAAFESTVWSSSFDGARQVFTKGTTTSTKAYKVDFGIVFNDAAGARTDSQWYLFKMVRKPGPTNIKQSTMAAVVPATSEGNSYGSCSHGFIIKEATLSPVDYYFQILGPTGRNITIEEWSISIHEL